MFLTQQQYNNLPWSKEASATPRTASASSIRPFRVKVGSWWTLSLRSSRAVSSSSSLRPSAVSSSRIHAVLLAIILCVRFLRTSPAKKRDRLFIWKGFNSPGGHFKLILNLLRSLPIWNASILIVILISICWGNMWLVENLRRWQWSSVSV